MRACSGEYPRELAHVIGHAKRLMKVLGALERARGEAWFLGRASELRGVVSLAVADWRAGASDPEGAERAILAHVDTLHRGAASRLRCAVALACCEPGDVITAVVPDQWQRAAPLDAASTAAMPVTHGPTAPAGWVDGPEILARVHGGGALVDRIARAIARQVGQGTATLDDLRAFGREGLLDAARAFDEGRGVPFERWASLRIRNSMIDGVRRWGAVPPRARKRMRALEETDSLPVVVDDRAAPTNGRGTSAPVAWARAAPLDAAEEGVIGASDGSDGLGATPEALLEKAELAALVRRIVARLPDRERALVHQNYFEGLTIEQAAASMGVSRSWAHRVHARAIETLERELRKHDGHAAKGGRPWTPSRP